MKWRVFALILVLLPLPMLAQNATLSATITASDGCVYSGARYNIAMYDASGNNINPGYVIYLGSTPTYVPQYQGTTDSFGHFSQPIIANSSVTQPTGTTYKITISSQNPGNPPVSGVPPVHTFSYAFTITANLDLTTALSAAAAPLGCGSGGGGSGVVQPGTQKSLGYYPNAGSHSVVGPSGATSDSSGNLISPTITTSANKVISVIAPPYNAVCDGLAETATLTITSGVTSGFTFSASDVGKTLYGGNGTNSYTGTILSVASGNATLSVASSVTLTLWTYGTNNATAIASAFSAASSNGFPVQFPAGTCVTGTITYAGQTFFGAGKDITFISGLPGQDVFSTTDGSTASLPSFANIYNLTIQVDGSINAAATAAGGNNSFPNRIAGTAGGTTAISAAAGGPPAPGPLVFINGANGNCGTAITATQTTLTISCGQFNQISSYYFVGNSITVNGAGVAGGNLTTTVASVTDATHIVLSAAASTTVTNATATLQPGAGVNPPWYIGNCGFAIPASSGAAYPGGINGWRFHNIHIVQYNGVTSSNYTCAIFLQAPANALTYENVDTEGTYGGIIEAAPATNNSSYFSWTPDTSEYKNVNFKSHIIPMTWINGSHRAATSINIYGTNRPFAQGLYQFGLVLGTSVSLPSATIDRYYDECWTPNTGEHARFSGQQDNINGGTLGQCPATAYITWLASNSTVLTVPGLFVQNRSSNNVFGNPPSTILSPCGYSYFPSIGPGTNCYYNASSPISQSIDIPTSFAGDQINGTTAGLWGVTGGSSYPAPLGNLQPLPTTWQISLSAATTTAVTLNLVCDSTTEATLTIASLTTSPTWYYLPTANLNNCVSGGGFTGNVGLQMASFTHTITVSGIIINPVAVPIPEPTAAGQIPTSSLINGIYYYLPAAPANAMTTLGDTLYGGASGIPTRLPGNTTASILCLTQQGTGTVSAAPLWGACSGSTATAWSALTSGTNTGMAAICGSGCSIAVTGTGTNQATSLTVLTGMPAQSGDSVVMNATGGSAAPTAVSMPTSGTNGCAGSTNALIYNTTSHTLGCNTSAGGITQLTGDVAAGPGSGSQAATIQSNAVTTAKINNSAVTLAKIQNAVSNSVLLGSSQTGSGSPYSELTVGTGLAVSGSTLNATGASGGFAGTVTYTSSHVLGGADNGFIVVMNCSSACNLTLPNPQPSTTFLVSVVSIGSSTPTVVLGSSMTWWGGASVPVLLKYNMLPIAADSGTSTNYVGQTPLVAGNSVTITSAATGQTIAVGGGVRKGTFVCTGGGTITITNSNYITTSDVVITMNTAGGTITTPPAFKTVTSGTGFSVLCGATDTSTYNYDILN